MSSPSATSLFDAVRTHLSRFAPFNEMQRADMQWLVERLKVEYYPKDAVLLGPASGEVGQLYIIKQGSVLGESDASAGDGANLQLGEGECFPLGALLARRSVANIYRAAADTFCYQLPAADFAVLMQRSEPFRDFCTRRIAHLLERSHQTIQAEYTRSAMAQQTLSTPLASLVRRAPVTCAATDTIESVLTRMRTEDVGSMVIVADASPVGIFTLHDLLARVALARVDLSVPIQAVMTHEPIALPGHATAQEAALAMAQHGIRHVLVTDGTRFAGVVSEKDLFSVQRVGLTQISLDIRNAKNVAELALRAGDIRALARNMLAQGVGAEQLTQLISALNDLLSARLIELAAAEQGVTSVRYCWLALGSEGRVEQTLATDQDNGIVFEGGEAERSALLRFAQQVNAGLDACGFPLCKGGIMASNPQWCLTRAEWQARFSDWIDRGDPQDLLHASIFFDFRPLHGEAELAQTLRTWLAQAARANPRFLHQMAANALRNRPPLGVVRDFVLASGGEYEHTIDLKLNGTTPFVDAARIYSLAAGDTHTNTVLRLRAAATAMNIPPDEVAAWADAFEFVQLLKLRNQHLREAEGQSMHNHIDPDELNELERRILKEAFRQARKLQQRLALDYGL